MEEGYRVVWTFPWNVWLTGGDETEGMQQELLSCTDGQFPEQKLLLCHFHTHTHTSVGTNEASLGTCGIRLQEYRLKVDWFIPRQDKWEACCRGNGSLFPSCRPDVCMLFQEPIQTLPAGSGP